MAGNVKEWCWNSVGEKRYILGGAWNEPTYMFTDADAQSPFERSSTFGIRLIQSTSTVPAAASAAVEWPYRDLTKEKPIPESVIWGLQPAKPHENYSEPSHNPRWLGAARLI